MQTTKPNLGELELLISNLREASDLLEAANDPRADELKRLVNEQEDNIEKLRVLLDQTKTQTLKLINAIKKATIRN